MSDMDPYRLDGRVALVTGAANGIGLAICQALARQGATLVLLDRDESVHETAKTFQGSLAVVADVTDETALERVVEQIESQLGSIDILINNAGVVALSPAETLSEQDWDKTLDINLKGVFLTSQIVGRTMLSREAGVIINMASKAGVMALDQHLAYGVSKAGVIALTRSLALEWSPRGVRVNAVSPTIVMTELGRTAWDNDAGEAARSRMPMRRFAEPEEIANAVAWLASPGASMVSGENLLVDGGYTIS